MVVSTASQTWQWISRRTDTCNVDWRRNRSTWQQQILTRGRIEQTWQVRLQGRSPTLTRQGHYTWRGQTLRLGIFPLRDWIHDLTMSICGTQTVIGPSLQTKFLLLLLIDFRNKVVSSMEIMDNGENNQGPMDEVNTQQKGDPKKKGRNDVELLTPPTKKKKTLRYPNYGRHLHLSNLKKKSSRIRGGNQGGRSTVTKYVDLEQQKSQWC